MRRRRCLQLVLQPVGSHPAPESVQPDPKAPIDREYWLAHCEGYRVDSPGGRVGLVEEVRRVDGDERPESLAVLAGMYGRRRLLIPVSEIDAIVPYEQRVFLRPSASIAGTARVAR